MPGTHLLPPNLLKLFAPRAPLPYTRPLDKDIERVTKKNVDGVGSILVMLRQSGGPHDMPNVNGDGMEEGEEPAFTLAEEIKRQLRREDRKKKKTEEFKIAKETCAPPSLHFCRIMLTTRGMGRRQAFRGLRSCWRSLQNSVYFETGAFSVVCAREFERN
jgi:hypothetical protein